VWLTGSDPHRQWGALCVDGAPWVGALEYLVDAAGDRASTDSAGPPASEWHPRADAPRAEKETATPAAASARAQQRRFDAFRRRYNEERPHEALALQTPASRWHPSPRPYPSRLATPEYPGHYEVRRVTSAGTFKFRGQLLFVSHALEDADIGLEEVADGLWNLLYYRTVLGRLDERTGKITAG